jgi:hypothetical protein
MMTLFTILLVIYFVDGTLFCRDFRRETRPACPAKIYFISLETPHF